MGDALSLAEPPTTAVPPTAYIPVILADGIDPESPFARALSRAIAGKAQLGTAGAASGGAPAWRRLVSGSAPPSAANASRLPAALTGPADILLDLRGRPATDCARLWRIVDATGRCVLQPHFLADRYHRRPSNAAMFLIESTDVGGAWHLLAEAHPCAARAYRDQLDTIVRTAAWLLAAALHRPMDPAPAWRPHGPDRMPRPLRAAVATLASRLRDRLIGEAWAIATLDEPAEALLADRTVVASRWITVPVADGFVADPFAWPGRPGIVLCERYFHRTGRGILQALTLRGNRIAAAETLGIDPGCHLSYPFAWRDGTRVLCLPEMGAARRQVLYELPPDAPPREVAVIAEDIAMADATPFRHEGRWWLAYTDTDIGAHDNLNLLYADCPEGPWMPCRVNPVKIDIRSSRGGGTPFHAGGMLLRPAQDCSATYGGALVLNRVDACTPDEYRETPIARLSPDPLGPFPHGLHTISIGEGVIWIDGKRELLDARILLQRITRRLRRQLGRPFARTASEPS